MQTWIDGVEANEFVGVGARFGSIVSKEKNANQTRLTLSDPRDCCSKPNNKVFPSNYLLLELCSIVSRYSKFVICYEYSL